VFREERTARSPLIDDMTTKRDKEAWRKADKTLDEELDLTFPASDTPAHTNPVQGTRRDGDNVKQDEARRKP
jgi:hypothetical protein